MRASLLAPLVESISFEVQSYCKILRLTKIFAFFSREVWWSEKRAPLSPNNFNLKL